MISRDVGGPKLLPPVPFVVAGETNRIRPCRGFHCFNPRWCVFVGWEYTPQQRLIAIVRRFNRGSAEVMNNVSKHDHPFQGIVHRLAECGGVEACRRFVFAEVDDQDLVFFHMHYGLKFRLQRHAINVANRTEEDRILPVLSITFAGLEHLTQSFRVTNIVANEVAAAHVKGPDE